MPQCPAMPFQGISFGGVMLGRGIALLSGALLLSGCMTAKVGTDYAAISQKIGPQNQGSPGWWCFTKRDGLSMALGLRVKLDGSPMGKVMVGTYAYADLAAGPTSSLRPSDVSRRDQARFQHRARPHLFFLSSPARGMRGNRTTMVADPAPCCVSRNLRLRRSGPADLIPLVEPTATTTLAELNWRNSVRADIIRHHAVDAPIAAAIIAMSCPEISNSPKRS